MKFLISDPSKLIATANELAELASIAGSLATTLQQESDSVRCAGHLRHNAQLPIAALPAELLADIFAYACSWTTQADENLCDLDEELEPPYSELRHDRHAIGATCTRWREIVVSTTLLWSSISVEVAWIDDRPHERYAPPSSDDGYQLIPSLQMVELELERSGTRLLHFQLMVQYRLEMPAELVKLIQNIFPRCVTIHLELPPLTPFAMPLEHTFVELPHLRSLGIELSRTTLDKRTQEWTRSAFVELSLAPGLRDFSTCYSIVPPPSSSGLALTRLCLEDGVPFPDALFTLRLCSQLRQLKWAVSPPKQQNIPRPSLHLHCLEELWFVKHGGQRTK